MEGDTDSLKQALRENFSKNEVANALKILQDTGADPEFWKGGGGLTGTKCYYMQLQCQ